MNWLSLALGAGLVILWIIGVSRGDSPTWMNWLVLVAAVVALVDAFAGPRTIIRDLGKRGRPETP
jgi:hypothetical protein